MYSYLSCETSYILCVFLTVIGLNGVTLMKSGSLLLSVHSGSCPYKQPCVGDIWITFCTISVSTVSQTSYICQF